MRRKYVPEFKEKFVDRYSALTDFPKFKEYSLKHLRKSIRINTLKIPVNKCKKRMEQQGFEMTQVPWCKEGFWIKGARRDVGNFPEHILGYIYGQESASMIPPVVLDPKPGDFVLDMCAAPGSKTTQLAMYMKNQGLLLANDVDHKRIASLGINTQRCGLANHVITMMQGHWFKKVNHEFDKILVDAPCSSTGTIRKSFKALEMWSPNFVKRCVGIQKQLSKIAFEKLKQGGTLVYSTCSCEPEENEAVVTDLLENYDNAKVEKIKLDIKRSVPVMEFEKWKFDEQVKNCLRIWPQDNDSEGFFVTKIKKL